MFRTIRTVLILLMILSFIPSITFSTSGDSEINHILVNSEPDFENTIEIPDGGGIYYLGNITLRKGVPVRDASFNLSVYPNNNGTYPEDVQLDVGFEQEYEYEFLGKGYGAMGRQAVFEDDSAENTYTFYSGGSKDSVRILLPKTASVSSASIGLTGKFQQGSLKTQIDNDHSFVGEVHPVDMDGDGDLDVVAVGNNEVVWYNNTAGDGSEWTEYKINTSHSNVARVYVGDIDNDGDYDVVAASRPTAAPYYGPLIHYRNIDGTGQTWAGYRINESIFQCGNVHIADMDNDGDSDVVATSESWLSGAVNLFWCNNTDGNGTSWKIQAIATSGVSIYRTAKALDVFDIDSDGDNDTVISSLNPQKINWFENLDGKAGSWSAGHIIVRPAENLAFNFVHDDIDSDGDMDLVAACQNCVKWYKHPSNPKSTWPAYKIGSLSSSWTDRDVAVGDFGNPGEAPDGNLDVVAVDFGAGDIIWYKNDGNPKKGNWESHYIATNHLNVSSVKVAEINDKDYVDLVVGANAYTKTNNVVWYEFNASFPTNVKLDIGSDTVEEWTQGAGLFNTSVTIIDLDNTFNTVIESRPSLFVDNYGNRFVAVEVNITTDTPGRVLIHDLNIVYDYTILIEGSFYKDLAQAINDHISLPGEGNDSIPLVLSCTTGGKFKIRDISIIYNDYPTSKTIRDHYIEEDTKTDSLFDLADYFNDDNIIPPNLTYDIVYYSNTTLADLYITDGHYLGIDMLSGANNDNWTGHISVIVKAVDEVGLEERSNAFNINVTPVNDEPVTGKIPVPAVSIEEGGKSPVIDLDSEEYFVDSDSIKLYYEYVIDPLNEIENEQLNVILDRQTWELQVEAFGDWYTRPGEPLRIRIFCDDDETDITGSKAYQDLIISVSNINDDAPVWSAIDDVIMNEDEPLEDALNLHSYIHDIDSPADELEFNLVSISNEHIHVRIDTDDNLDIWSVRDYFGTATVKLRATDGKNSDITTFNVVIKNVNDKPTVKLLSPVDGRIIINDVVELRWEGYDVDPGDAENLTYTIYLDTLDGDTVYQNYFNYEQKSIIITDLEDKTTYRWKVIPYDGLEEGICNSQPCPVNFTVDLEKRPVSELMLPVNNAIINKNYVVLIWDGYGPDNKELTYDVYLSDSVLDFPYPSSARVGSNILVTKILVERLTPYHRYYWTVVPSSPDGEGICKNGIWTFIYDPSQVVYELRLNTPDHFKIKEGASDSIAIQITNIGKNPDIVIPSIDEGMLELSATLKGKGTEFWLDRNETLTLSLNISTHGLPTGTYDITVSVKSLGSGDSFSKIISIEIYDPGKDNDVDSSKRLLQNLLILSFIILIIIVIMIFIFFQLKRNKLLEEEMARVEAEIFGPGSDSGILEPLQVKYLPGSVIENEKEPVRKKILKHSKETLKLPPTTDVESKKTSEQDETYTELSLNDTGNGTGPTKDSPPAAGRTEPELLDPEQLLEKLEDKFKNKAISEETYNELKQKYENRLEPRDGDG